MTVEAVILAIFGVLVLGAFLGPGSLFTSFEEATPRLAARVERNIAIGYKFYKKDGSRSPGWKPSKKGL